MKFLLTFACVAIYVSTINGLAIPDDIKAEMLATKKACMAEVPNFKQEHWDKVKKNEFAEDDEDLKKFVLCFHLKVHAQNEDGSFNVEHIKETFEKMFGNKDHDKDVDECTKEDHHDALQNAWEFLKCIHPKIGDVDAEA